jgi:tetratricopeptide (TPR) repeat protein
MGLFNIFKKQADDSPARELFLEARGKFNDGDHQQALQTLIYGFRKDVDYRPLYELSIACLDKMGGEEEKQLFEEALRNFDSADPFIQLGTHFSSTGHYMLVQPFLEKALQLKPGDVDAAHDLAIAYARRFDIPKAVAALESVPAETDFWAFWFLTKCWLLNSEPAKAAPAIASMDRYLEQNPGEEGFEILQLKVEELKEIAKRFRTIQQPQTHIRDWQYIQYGSAILDYFDEGDDKDVAGGRYVASWGSLQGLRENINTLKAFADHLSLSFTGIKYINDRHSAIIGLAIASIFGLPAAAYRSEADNSNCLVVAGNTSSFDEFEELRTVGDGLVIYALNHNWLQNSFVTPDIIGFMSQSYYFPWDVTLRVVDGKVDEIPPDNRAEDEIVDELVQLAPAAKDHAELFSFYAQRRDHLKGIGAFSNQHRYNFMLESPVPGSYFGV